MRSASPQKKDSRPLKASEVIETEEKYLKDLRMCMSAYHDAMLSYLMKGTLPSI